MLRFVHGDIYSKERLFRFGMAESPLCEHCNEVETINHKILECTQAQSFWRELATLTNRGRMPLDIDFAVGAYEGCDKAELTLHTELITRLIRNTRSEQLPNLFIRSMIKTLQKKEKGEIKRSLESLLL